MEKTGLNQNRATVKTSVYSANKGKGKRTVESSPKISDKRERIQDNDPRENASSCVTEATVKNILANAGISMSDYEYMIPSKNQRANNPPEEYITVFTEQVNAGLRFPLQDLVMKVCSLMSISPSQLMPDAYCMITNFIECATSLFPKTTKSFFSLFVVCPATMKGLFHFVPCVGAEYGEYKRPSTFTSWETEFFFLRHKDTSKSWDCLAEWKETCLQPPFHSGVGKYAVEIGLLERILVHGIFRHGESPLSPIFDAVKVEPPSDASPTLEVPLSAPPAPKTPLLVTSSEPPRDNELPSPNGIDRPSSNPILAISKILELSNVPRERFDKLTSDLAFSNSLVQDLAQKLVSDRVLANTRIQELEHKLESDRALANSRIQELEKELEDERSKSDLKSTKSLEAVKAMEKRLANNLQDEISKEVAKITESLM